MVAHFAGAYVRSSRRRRPPSRPRRPPACRRRHPSQAAAPSPPRPSPQGCNDGGAAPPVRDGGKSSTPVADPALLGATAVDSTPAFSTRRPCSTPPALVMARMCGVPTSGSGDGGTRHTSPGLSAKPLRKTIFTTTHCGVPAF